MRSKRKTLSLALCACVLLALMATVVVPLIKASVADDLEATMLGSLSARYESNGDPGAIAQVAGDPGGKSYGTYMFASNMGTPQRFFAWCRQSENGAYRGFGNTLGEAFEKDGSVCGANFDAAWRSLAAGNADGFGRAQRDFIRATYYDPYVAALAEAVPGFDVSNYSIALRNVLWSRVVQHGQGGAKNVFTRAMDALGGFVNQPETELINAIYAESGRLTGDDSPKMEGSDARSYGVEGLSMAYYTGCSPDIQLGVYIRLRINEPAKAQAMLSEYGYGDAPIGDGNYIFGLTGNDKQAFTAGSSGLVIAGRDNSAAQQFRLDFHASGYYTVTNLATGQRLTASDGGVSLSGPSAGNAQLWSLSRLNSGFALRNRATGQYLGASRLSAGGKAAMTNEKVQWQLIPGNANWTLSGASYPTYANGLTVGDSGYPFRGTLRSNYTITYVRSAILNAGGTALYTSEARPNAAYYDLGRMDSDMAFSALGGGSYTLVITADDSSGSHYELRSPFYVTDGSHFVITLDPAGGTCSPTTLTLQPGQAVGELPKPQKSGYVFVGWYDSNGGKYSETNVMPARNLLLTAHYAKAYTYTFYNYDGKTVLASGSLMEGQPIPVPKNPSRPADKEYFYTFKGWDGYTSGMVMGAKDLSFTALYDAHSLSGLTEMMAIGSYRLENGYLRMIPLGTTAEELLAGLTPSEYIGITRDGAPVTGPVGTGMTVGFAPAGEVTQTAAIVVTGDVNGDGLADITDMMKINSHLLERSTLTGAAAQAADLNGDGIIDITDFAQSLSVTLKRRDIKPN